MKAIANLLLLLVLPFFVFAQKKEARLYGKITDASSKPLPGASVYLLNTGRGVVTDSLGDFSFSGLPRGVYTVRVSAIGFVTDNLSVDFLHIGTTNLQVTMAQSESTLEEVLVTAEKKEEIAQRVPLSLSVLSAAQVREYRLWSTNELTAIVPNLYSSNPGDDRNVTSVRGIGTTSYDPAVTTYIDGVNQFNLDSYLPQLFDVERIEVLRGPQGTLYGRNAMGGVINIVTKQPTNTLSGFAELSMGNYEDRRYSAGLRAPVVRDKLFIGAAALFSGRNGYYRNDFNGSDFDHQHAFSGSYFLKWFAGSNWIVNLNAKHRSNRNYGAFPLVNGVDAAFAQPFVLSQNATAQMIDNTFNSSLQVQHNGERMNFSSQTAWQSNRRYYDNPLDGDFSPADAVTIINDYGGEWNKVKVFTQEFRFSSPGSKDRLNWTAGAYFFSQDNPVKQATHFGKDASLIGVPDTDFSLISTTEGKSHGLAFYGQLTYPLTEELELIGGLRYDYEKKKYKVRGEYQKDPDPNPLFETRPDTSASVHFNAWSPKAGLNYHLSDGHHLFLVYSRGYRTGGLTQLSSDPSQPPLYPYQPEFSNNIELGSKNMFFNDRLRMNFALFLTFVNDVQVPTLVLPDAITVTRNAGKLSSKGIEMELAAAPIKGWRVDYNFGYTHATYTDLKLSQGGNLVNLDGSKQVFTPDYTSMLAAQYDLGLGKSKKWNVFVRGEWQAIGSQYFDLANTIEQKAYGLFNARAGIALRKLEIAAWARNIGDKKYIAYAYDFGAVHLGDPFTFGISIRAGFPNN